MNRNNNAYMEVITILNYLDKEDYNKIPTDLIKVLELNKNNNYKFKLDWNIGLREQHLMRETKAILFNIFRDYLSTSTQRKVIVGMQNKEKIRIESQKKKLYNIDIFEKKNIENKETGLINVSEKDTFKRIIDLIIKFFKGH